MYRHAGIPGKTSFTACISNRSVGHTWILIRNAKPQNACVACKHHFKEPQVWHFKVVVVVVFLIQPQKEGDFPCSRHKSKSTKLFVCRLWVIGTSNKMHFMILLLFPQLVVSFYLKLVDDSLPTTRATSVVVHHAWWCFFDLFQPSSYEYVRLVDEEWKQTYTGAADWDAVTFPGDALRRNVTMIGHIRASLQLGN